MPNFLLVTSRVRFAGGGYGGSTPAGITANQVGEHLHAAEVAFWPPQLTTAIREVRPDDRYFNFTLLFVYSILVSLPAITILTYCKLVSLTINGLLLLLPRHEMCR